MKTTLISVATSLVVTVALFFGLEYLQTTSDPGLLSIRAAELTKAETTTALSIASLRSELADIRKKISRRAGADNTAVATLPAGDSGFDELLERVESLEDAIAELSSKKSVASKDGGGDSYRQQLSLVDYQSSEMSDLNRNALAESQFDSDAGLPLGEFAESVEEGVHAIDGVDVQGLECRTSICKVTFSARDSSSVELADSKSEVADQLISRANGREVEIRYANDAYGNEVMYVQLR